MKRGISFNLPEKMTSRYFSRVFNDIKTDSLVWRNVLSQCEMLCEFNLKIEDTYSEQELLDLFRKNVYIISIKLQAYSGQYAFTECHTYEEFLTSDCELLLLICDVREVDIYAKNQNDIDELYHNATLCDFENVKILTDYNDSRTGLDIITYD